MSESNEISVTLEAGHIYAPELYVRPTVVNRPEDNFSGEGAIVNEPVGYGLAIARQLRQNLSERGLSVQQILFVDDVDPRIQQSNSIDSWRWEMFIQRPIQQIKNREKDAKILDYSEFALLREGEVLVGRLRDLVKGSDKCRLSQDHNSVIFGSGKNREKIKLVGYSEKYPQLPSCEVLDTCMYQKRLVMGSETVTILPINYKDQQSRVKRLLGLLEKDPNVTVIYHDDKGSIVDTATEQWHNHPTQFSVAIKETLLSMQTDKQ